MERVLNEAMLAGLHGRAFLYQLAHTVFGGEPSEELLGVAASSECRLALRGLAEECGAVSPLLEYAERIASGSLDLDEGVKRCKSAYNKAVAGLGSKRRSHPWESAYTSSKKLLMQVETLEVRNFYRAFGYLPQMYPKVADDHISLECAFMAALAGRSISSYEEGDAEMLAKLVEGQLSFLSGHLLKWADAYAADLHEDVPGSLYDVLATSLAAFARQDKSFLQGLDA